MTFTLWLRVKNSRVPLRSSFQNFKEGISIYTTHILKDFVWLISSIKQEMLSWTLWRWQEAVIKAQVNSPLWSMPCSLHTFLQSPAQEHHSRGHRRGEKCQSPWHLQVWSCKGSSMAYKPCPEMHLPCITILGHIRQCLKLEASRVEQVLAN